ncbi:MAG TPA: hypothetical protein VMT82_02480 [candidate division Zixibacteria bacterium]|nr:hypothetical protein [candidate division Zixibacteria bacterium]
MTRTAHSVSRSMVLALVVIGMAASCAIAFSQEKLQREGRTWVRSENGTLPTGRSVRVITGVGNVTIDNVGKPFTYTVRKRSSQVREQDAKKQFSALRVSGSRRGDVSVLEGDWPRNSGMASGFGADFFVHVPRELDLVLVDTLSGNVTVTSSFARLDLGTRDGNIQVNEAGNLVRVRTMGGNITIGRANGDVFIRSGGGDVRVGQAKGKVEVVSMGGNIWMDRAGSAKVRAGGSNIDIHQCLGDLNINTGGGGVSLGEVGGSAVVESGGGNIRVGSVHGRMVASTANGNIEMWKLGGGAQAQSQAGTIVAEFVGSKDSFSESFLHTTAGDIVVYLKSGTPATVQAASEMAKRNQGIHSEFPELRIVSEGSEIGPKMTYAEGSVNGGGPLLKVRTSVGQIDFRKGK